MAGPLGAVDAAVLVSAVGFGVAARCAGWLVFFLSEVRVGNIWVGLDMLRYQSEISSTPRSEMNKFTRTWC